MTKIINVNIEKCTGCGTCELWCSFKHHAEFNPLKSRIHKTVFMEEEIAIPVLCRQCEDAWCARICPSGAISKHANSLTGATVVLVDKNRCVGCRMCMLACPYGCILVSDEGYAEKCDLCDGVPQCVKFCPRGALEFDDGEQGILDRKQKVAATLLTAYQEAE
ncbi:MAG: 4Fe-4S dicluster domain-containing protein [bacterium]